MCFLLCRRSRQPGSVGMCLVVFASGRKFVVIGHGFIPWLLSLELLGMKSARMAATTIAACSSISCASLGSTESPSSSAT
ncbi:hypothetical protein Veis_3444 [Verminephrobacter eiseniae EF01-2]|uniref:Uncharacterized protein n=1 Tax=Verminephrobacter eiseniae (strain EF01-2) TaxID=391735 RepID=A1WNF8_VEREI|nr:hypothetical protein Veis_3444 [Verminephrobacter eiseniae EF01-2]